MVDCIYFCLLEIVPQTQLVFAVGDYGTVQIAGEFKDVDATSELKNKIKYVGFFLFTTLFPGAL